jgi:hypothetical protein
MRSLGTQCSKRRLSELPLSDLLHHYTWLSACHAEKPRASAVKGMKNCLAEIAKRCNAVSLTEEQTGFIVSACEY